MKRYADAEPVLSSRKDAERPIAGPVKYFLGTALANLGKFDEAEKELSAAVAAGGNEMVEAHRILAIIYNVKGEKNEPPPRYRLPKDQPNCPGRRTAQKSFQSNERLTGRPKQAKPMRMAKFCVPLIFHEFLNVC